MESRLQNLFNVKWDCRAVQSCSERVWCRSVVSYSTIYIRINLRIWFDVNHIQVRHAECRIYPPRWEAVTARIRFMSLANLLCFLLKRESLEVNLFRFSCYFSKRWKCFVWHRRQVLRIYSVDFRWTKYEHGTLVERYCEIKLNCLERNPSVSHFNNHKFHMDCAGIEHDPQRWTTFYAWTMAGNLFLSEKTVLLRIFFRDV